MLAYIKSLKSLSGLVAIAGVAVPAITFFTGLDAPLLPASGLIAAAVATAALIFAGTGCIAMPELRRIGRRRLVIGILLVVIYVVMYDWTTVSNPQTSSRFQVGFGLATSSLTDSAQVVVARHNPTKRQLMGRMGGFQPGGVYRIWHRASVYIAGVSLIFLSLTATAQWCGAWGYIARLKALNDPGGPPSSQDAHGEAPERSDTPAGPHTADTMTRELSDDS